MQHAIKLLGIATLTTLVMACRVGDGSGEQEQMVSASRSAIVEGTPEALGVLGFLNDADTTLYVLDELVPLDKRAAENLIAHRDGDDGLAGSDDDDAFDDIAEVDAISYVGPVALDRLRAYAAAQGYQPSGGDLLGVYDDTAFTVDEAEATLELVNTASAVELDDDVGLDSRAVDNILDARTLASMLELEAIKYIGPAAMLKLREYPKTIAPPGGSTPDGDTCSAHEQCQSALCGGLTIFSGSGWCIPQWMQGSFENTTTMALANGGSVTSDIQVSGLATVPLDVVVTLDIDHPRKHDLVVALHQPGGGYQVLWDHQANPPATVSAGWGIERDNMVNGVWTLEVVDTASGQGGTLHGWSMWLTSNMD